MSSRTQGREFTQHSTPPIILNRPHSPRIKIESYGISLPWRLRLFFWVFWQGIEIPGTLSLIPSTIALLITASCCNSILDRTALLKINTKYQETQ